MNTLQEAAQTFNAETKKMFKSCKHAVLNIHGPREDWEAWGDFSRRNDAIDAARMWGLGFRKKITITPEGRLYRVTAKV